MKVGIGTRPIEVAKNSILAGYAPIRRASGVHDLPWIRVIVFDATPQIVLVQMDILIVETILWERIVEQLEPFGFERQHLLISATHTHSSIGRILDTQKQPLSALLAGPLEEETLDKLAQLVKTCVLEALQDLKETTIRFAETTYRKLGSQRNDPDCPGDQQLAVIELLRLDQSAILIYNLACHPTVLDRFNTWVSADFCGAVQESLKDRYRMVVFLNGSCGDMSTRFTRRNSSFEETERLGKALAKTLTQSLKNSSFQSLDQIELSSFTIQLKGKPLISKTLAQSQLEKVKAELSAWKTGSEGERKKLQEKQRGAELTLLQEEHPQSFSDRISVNCSLLVLQGKPILFTPLELYSSLSLQIKAAFPIWTVGYTNGHLGYMPDQAGYQNQDYETALSSFAENEGERFVERLLQRLKEQRSIQLISACQRELNRV